MRQTVPMQIWDPPTVAWADPVTSSGAVWRRYVGRVRALMGIPEDAVLPHYRAQCWYCGLPLVSRMSRPFPRSWAARTVDHVIPRSSGGQNRAANYLTACKRCNEAKASMSVEEFRRFEDIERFWGEPKRVGGYVQHKRPSGSFVADLMNSLSTAANPPGSETIAQAGAPHAREES